MISPLGSRYGIQGALGRSVKRAGADGWWAVDPETGTLINLSKYGNKVYRIVGYRKVN